MLLIGWKIVISALMVVAVTWVAERLSPRFAGVLLGFPLGLGLALFFIGLEQGPFFAAESALWSIQGVLASLGFCMAYNGATRIQRLPRLPGIITSVLFALAAYFATALLIMRCFPEDIRLRNLLVALALPAAAVLFRLFPFAALKQQVQLTPLIIGCRALAAALVILLVTGTATLIGPQWSGLFSAFPTTILPTVVILHIHYGPGIINTVFRELPQGMLALVLFAICIHFSYPILGVIPGICLSYLASACYLLAYEIIFRQRINQLLDAFTGLMQKHTTLQ